MTRLASLALALLALACSDASAEEQDMQSRIPPWHLWGSNQVADLHSEGAVAVGVTQQIANIEYGRPDTWTFLFVSNLVDFGTMPGTNVVEVHFDLTVGAGRSQVQLRDFVTFRWDYTDVPIEQHLWTTTGRNKIAEVSGAPPTVTSNADIIDLPFSNCQVFARVSLQTLSPPQTVKVENHAYFAPRSHVRAEWFAKGNDGGPTPLDARLQTELLNRRR